MSCERLLLAELLSLAEDRHARVEAFRDAISESSLCAAVVRVANSGIYGMAGSITGLDRVVLVLGTQVATSIVTTLVVSRTLRAVPGLYPPDELALHALETGICAEQIAQRLGLDQEAEAYRAGLLHGLASASWDLPDALTEVQTHWREPHSAPPARQELCALLAAAHEIGSPSPCSARSSAETPAASALGLLSEDCQELRRLSDERLKRVASVLASA